MDLDSSVDVLRLQGALDALGEPALLLDGENIAHANPAAMRLAEGLAGPTGDPERSLSKLLAGSDNVSSVRIPLGPPERQRTLMLLLDYEPKANGAGKADNAELELALARLNAAQEQLMQSEKMASLGQLAAGIAHEINNPIGYVHSNLGTLQEYTNNLFGLIECYESIVHGATNISSDRKAELDQRKRTIEYDFLVHDLPQLLNESREGIDRVKRIVNDLKDFSRADRIESWSLYDLHRGLDSTIGIVWNELKYKATVNKEYGTLPLVECVPSQVNQVFMNILVNAGQSIDEKGTITIVTGTRDDSVFIQVTDTGKGIPPEILGRIFDPFFTTKPVGKGTGLGLSISYGIVRKHNGEITVESKVDAGTTFRVTLPVRQPVRNASTA